MKPIKKNRLSQPSEFIKMMVIIMVFVSVYLFSKDRSEDQTIINSVVLLILLVILQLVFVLTYKKGVRTPAFWFLIFLALISVLSIGTIFYLLRFGAAFQH